MKKLLLFLCLFGQIGLAETPKIDSLKRELGRLDKQPNGYTKDTLRYQTMKAIMRGYSDVNIDSSAYYNTLMIRLCEGQKLQKELIYAYQYAGYLYLVKGNQFKSIQFYYEALSLAEKLKKYTQVAAAYWGLAHAYTSLKNYPKATEFCQKGLDVLSKYPDANDYPGVRVRLGILNALGGLCQDQGKLADALKVNQAMYKLAQTERDQWYEAQGLHAIGSVYKDKGNMVKALDYHKKALPLAQATGDVELEGNILVNTADLYIRQKKWKEALSYCTQAKQMAKQVKNSGILSEAYEKLYIIYKNTGEPAKALKAHENFILLKDSLSKGETQQRIKMLQAQYDNVQIANDLQQLQQQVQLLGIVAILLVAALLFWNNKRLQARNRELIQTNKKIKEALFKGQTIERKRVALELHDNLSSLLSAVNMSIQSINPQNLSESEQSVYRNVRQLIQNAYAEVRNISHNILPAELEREGLAATLAILVGQLNQNSPLQFSLTITDLQDRLPVEIEFNVYSIVLELINNAIKHAKATSVSITLLRTGSDIDVSVTDDGVGLGQNHSKRGVGLQNIHARLESLGGTFTTALPAETGTRIGIKIPIETVRINGNVSIA